MSKLSELRIIKYLENQEIDMEEARVIKEWARNST